MVMVNWVAGKAAITFVVTVNYYHNILPQSVKIDLLSMPRVHSKELQIYPVASSQWPSECQLIITSSACFYINCCVAAVLRLVLS